MSRLEQEFEGQVEFLSLNISKGENSEARTRYKVIGLPQYVSINARGKIVASRYGIQTYETLKADIEKALADQP